MNEVFQVIFPGLMLMWVGFIANGVFVDLFTEFRANTIARMISSGVSLYVILLSKIIRCILICSIAEFLLITFTWIVFDLNWQNPLLLALLLTAFNLCTTGVLALIYGYARSTELANGIVVFYLLITALLGGGMIPFNEMPSFMQAFGQWTAQHIAHAGIESILQSRSIWESLRPSVILSSIGIVLAFLGSTVIRKQFQTGKVA